MNPSRYPSRAGGCLLAFSVVAGALVGVVLGQPSVGVLAGAGVGLVLVIAVFLGERR